MTGHYRHHSRGPCLCGSGRPFQGCLQAGIAAVRPGRRLWEIGRAIEDLASGLGYSDVLTANELAPGR